MSDAKSVARRKVFYIPGFDPFPPRRYRELYRTESLKQSRISGYEITQAPLAVEEGFGWSVHAVMEGQQCHTEIEVLAWSDIVKSSMSDGIGATYLQMLRTAWIYIATGTLWDIAKLRKGPVIAALYPIGFLVAQAVFAIGVAMILVHLLTPVFGLAAWVGLGVIWPILALFRRWDGKVFAYYLMHDYAHSAQFRGAYPPELRARLTTFSDRLATALRDAQWDEVLIVGHSSGAHLGATVLADLIRNGAVAAAQAPVSFLTLGQVFPMVAFLPRAQELRRDMVVVGTCADLTWVDVTAPGDGCAFALCDPLAVTGLAREDQRGPLVLSAAFTQTLKPETWAALRWRFFRLHFQYLCAFDNVGEYDYFRITAGPMTLSQRFAGRDPSRSRITRPTARYRDVAQ